MLRDSVSVQVTVDAAPDAVWQFLTARRSSWWPDMHFDALVGAPLIETWTERGQLMSAAGVVTRCEHPEVLAFSWSEPSWEGPLDVMIRLEASGPSTSVTLTESGFVRAQTASSLPEEHEEGWRFHLARLKRASETDATGHRAQ